jgi:hypothetical protein
MSPLQRTDLKGATVLAGAGVSVDAGLPTALALYDELVDSLVHRHWAAEELKRLARLPRDDAVDIHDAIRFEVLLLWLGDVFDAELGFFSMLDDPRSPSRLHFRIAAAAPSGLQILTTNFDDLFERALVDLGEFVTTVDAHAMQKRPRARVSGPTETIEVVKLHGSRALYGRRRTHSSNKALQATIETIAAANPDRFLNTRAEERLLRAIDGRTLVVCGYSGSDDLDIVPTLMGSRPSSVIWIDHRVQALRSSRFRRPTRRSPQWAHLAWRWQEAGVHVIVLRGLTDSALARIGFPEPPDRKYLSPDPDWRPHVKRWSRKVQCQDPSGLGAAALLFGELGRYEEAIRALKESRPSALPRGGWTKGRKLYELA